MALLFIGILQGDRCAAAFNSNKCKLGRFGFRIAPAAIMDCWAADVGPTSPIAN